jgi:hypothetical protein
MLQFRSCGIAAALWPPLALLLTSGLAPTNSRAAPQLPPVFPSGNATAAWADLPPDDNSVKLTRAETACLAAGKILWPTDGACHRLLDQGPCEPGLWLVLDASSTRVECRPRRCPCDAARPDLCEVEVETTGKCHVAATAGQDGGVCGPGEQLTVTPRGYGVCGCISRPPHVLWPSENEVDGGRCYPLYRQGPCEAGYQLRFSRSRQAPVCQPALCADGSVLTPSDGACHPLDQPGGPCTDEFHILTLDPASLEPVCRLDESRVKRVYDVIPAGLNFTAPLSSEIVTTQDCRLDARGRCVRSFGGLRTRGTGAGAARGYVSWLKSFRS